MIVQRLQKEKIYLFGKLVLYLKMIKLSHSIFALPFALAAAVIAASGIPSLQNHKIVPVDNLVRVPVTKNLFYLGCLFAFYLIYLSERIIRYSFRNTLSR